MATSITGQFMGKIKEIGPWSALSLKVTLSAFYFLHLANKNMKGFFRRKLKLIGTSNNVTEVLDSFRFWFYPSVQNSSFCAFSGLNS